MDIEAKNLSQELPARPVIKRFREDAHPIFVVYGAPPNFKEVLSGFRDHFQGAAAYLYLSVDMGLKKRETPGETCFEIVRQLVDSLIDTTTDPNGKGQLLETFRLLVNVKEKTQAYAPEDKLAEFVRYAEFSCYPALGTVLSNRKDPIIIEFRQFEKVAVWGPKIHNFIFESLLNTLAGVDLRFVLFVQSPQKPSLFYGSNEEGGREWVTFYKLEGPESEDASEREYNNYRKIPLIPPLEKGEVFKLTT